MRDTSEFDTALEDLSSGVAGIEYNRSGYIHSLTILSEAIAELKLRRQFRIREIPNEDASPR